MHKCQTSLFVILLLLLFDISCGSSNKSFDTSNESSADPQFNNPPDNALPVTNDETVLAKDDGINKTITVESNSQNNTIADGAIQVEDTQVEDRNVGANRVEDVDAGWPDASFEISQDSGQCVAEDYLVVSTARKPLAVYVVVDGTSADQRAAPAWSLVLLSYTLMSPESWGISSMGFQFVGPDSQCGSSFDVPLSPIVSLTENPVDLAATLLSTASMVSMNPSPVVGTTLHPILPALQGAIQYAKSYEQLHQDYDVVLWLLTDGLPEGCDSTVESVAQVAADARLPPSPIETYVLGIDKLGAGDLQSLDQIAKNGGTEKATFVGLADALVGPGTIVITAGSNQEALVFLDTVGEQWRSPLPCEYALPAADQNEQVDLDMINLYFKPKGGPKTLIYNVAGADSCDPIEGGWFYNSSSNGLIACDKTCDTLKSKTGEVDVELGCPTIVL